MNTKTAVWFGRSSPTMPQVKEAQEMGYRIVDPSKGRRLAHRPLRTTGDLLITGERLKELAGKNRTRVVFGTFPPPLVETMQGHKLYASWQVDSGGQKQHRRWCEVSKTPVPV